MSRLPLVYGDPMIKEICETCEFWGQSSGEFGVCIGPEPADRAAKTDTCEHWKLRKSLADKQAEAG